jgi:hypothetical protein
MKKQCTPFGMTSNGRALQISAPKNTESLSMVRCDTKMFNVFWTMLFQVVVLIARKVCGAT